MLAGVVMLAAGWPAVLAARLVVPYVVSNAPLRSLPDDRCELAHAGWRRFLWLNSLPGCSSPSCSSGWRCGERAPLPWRRRAGHDHEQRMDVRVGDAGLGRRPLRAAGRQLRRRWAHSWATCPSGTGMRGTAAPAGAVPAGGPVRSMRVTSKR